MVLYFLAIFITLNHFIFRLFKLHKTLHEVILNTVFEAGSVSALKNSCIRTRIKKTAGSGSALIKTAGSGSAKKECGSTALA